MCWTWFKSIRHSLKNVGPSQNGPLWCPKLVTGLHIARAENHLLHNVNAQLCFTKECKRLTFSNLCRKLESDQCRHDLGTLTSFCSVLMLDRFDSIVWSQGSCPQQNALAFYHKCTHDKEQASSGQPKVLKTFIRKRKVHGSPCHQENAVIFLPQAHVHTQQGLGQ